MFDSVPTVIITIHTSTITTICCKFNTGFNDQNYAKRNNFDNNNYTAVWVNKRIMVS